jgi:hypothetical protein
MKILSSDNPCPGRYSKRASLEYKGKALPLDKLLGDELADVIINILLLLVSKFVSTVASTVFILLSVVDDCMYQ